MDIMLQFFGGIFFLMIIFGAFLFGFSQGMQAEKEEYRKFKDKRAWRRKNG